MIPFADYQTVGDAEYITVLVLLDSYVVRE